MKSLQIPLTEAEVTSNLEAYRLYPWGEDQEIADVRDFLKGLRDNSDGFVIAYKSSDEDSPYLYINGLNYKGRVEDFIEEEFTGSKAYWKTTEKDKIKNLLKGVKSVTYINNIHADKKAPIKLIKKPRLKVFAEILDTLFKQNKSEAISFFTHRDTGVARAVEKLDKNTYKIKSVNYKATCDTPRNENFGIDYLTAFVITKV
jgi:hypothetical protein